MMNLGYVKKENFPPFLHKIVKIDPKDIPITAYARLMCQHCGVWNRAILCPPMLYETYPQYKTIISSKKFFGSFNEAYVYVFQNDGSKRWWRKKDADNYRYIALVKRKGRQLKGCEASSARTLTFFMKRIKTFNTKRGFEVETFIQGHCDLCARKCPNRNNPPCKRGGLASLEATGINVYQLLKNLGIEYEYPVMNFLTQITLMIVR